MLRLLIRSALVVLWLPCLARAEMTCGIDHVVIDGVKIPYGTVVEVMGPWHWYSYGKHGSPGLKALRINGRPNDDDITVELVAIKNAKLMGGRGSYYKVRGPLMDACDGPNKKFNIIVEQLEAVAPPTIADSVNRTTTLKGIAAAVSRLSVGLGPEQVLLDGLAAWPTGVEGKWVAVTGTVRGEPGAWRIENPQWHFLRLDDQIGQTVSLEGVLRSGYGTWWFESREEKAYLTGANGRTMTFAWVEQGRRMRVTGKLTRQDRPSLDHRDYKTLPDLVPTFVIRGAEIEFLQPPDKQDRFLYRQPIRIEDGVPVLVPEGYPSPLAGYETKALFYAGRNHEVIEYIVRKATPEACDVMARRMENNEIGAPLRLLYAAVLACLNDDRGRDYLVRNLDDRHSESFLDALYCMGMFEWLRREKPVENAPPTDLAWAEKALISVTLDQQRIVCKQPYLKGLDSQMAVADAAVYYSRSQIPCVLAAMNSAVAQNALLKYLAENRLTNRPPNDDEDEERPRTFHEYQTDEVVAAICRRDELLPVDFLLQLEPLTAIGRYGRRELLAQLLRHKHPAAADKFLQELEGEYYEFAAHTSPEVAAAIRPHIPKLQGGAKACAMMLNVLAQEDPVPELLKMLDDDNWPVRRLVLHHLAKLGDARAVTRVGEILKSAPPEFFDRGNSAQSRWSLGNYTDPVDCGLDAIAKAGTDESIHALVGLLQVDLERFGRYYYRFGGDFRKDGYQRSVAGHLIDLTGESFGVDAEKWQNWLSSRGEPEQR